MILPNFRPPYLTPIKIKGGSSLGSLNWSDITFDNSQQSHSITTQQITGISSPKTLSINWTRAANTTYLFYRVAPTPPPEGLTLYNIRSTDPNAPSGLTFDPFDNDGSSDTFRDPCESSYGFTAAGAYPADTCDEIVVNNNDYVSFIYFGVSSFLSPFPFNSTIEIRDLDNGNALLDTFVCTAQS